VDHSYPVQVRARLDEPLTDAYPPFRLDQGGAGMPAPGPDDLAPASAAWAPAPAARVR
jgi:hypothetical protein